MEYRLSHSTYKTLTGIYSIVGIESGSNANFRSAILALNSEMEIVWVDTYEGSDMGSYTSRIDEMNEICLQNGDLQITNLKVSSVNFTEILSEFVESGSYSSDLNAKRLYDFIYGISKVKALNMRNGKKALPELVRHFNIAEMPLETITNAFQLEPSQYQTWATW